MKNPYIICHMMMSVDGRIDCGMIVKIAGSNEYYETLSALDVPTNLSGRVTAQLELAEPVNLKFLSVQPYDNGAVWLRYALH